jgi:hypothetical protein
MRTEFERHRFVSQLPVVDVLLHHSHAEYQVRLLFVPAVETRMMGMLGYSDTFYDYLGTGSIVL